MRSLAESPTGLVHLVNIGPRPRRYVVTMCGVEVNKQTWTRIRHFDHALHGKGKSTIARMVELPKCERCF